MTEIKAWDVTSADNNGAPPEGAPENMKRSDVNNVMREMMGAIRRDWAGVDTTGATELLGGGPWRDANDGNAVTRVSDTQVQIAGIDATDWFPAGRRVKINYASGNPGYAFVASSSFSSVTDVFLERFADVSPDDVVRTGPAITAFSFYAGFGGEAARQIGRGAFMDFDGFVVPKLRTAAGINAAIAIASTTGGIVFLDEDTYILEATVSIISGVKVWGRGVGKTILQAAAALDDTMVEFPDGANDGVFEGVTMDGNAANQSAGRGIDFSSPTSITKGCKVRDIYMHDIWGEGIYQEETTWGHDEVVLEDITILNTGDDAIHMHYTTNATRAIYINNIHITGPGTGGDADPSAHGISLLAFNARVSNVWIDMGSTALNSAPALSHQNPVQAAPNYSSFDNIQITTFQTSSCKALFLIGFCHITNSFFECGQRPIGSILIGASASNCTFHGGDELSISSNAVISSCTFESSGTITTPVINVADGADHAIIRNNYFANTLEDGINVLANATNTVIKDNYFETTAGDCIAVTTATAAYTIIVGNIFNATTGSEVVNGGNWTGSNNLISFHEGNDTGTLGTAETLVSAAKSYPLPPNGRRRFLIEVRAAFEVGSGANTLDLHFYSGATGSVGESVLTDQTTGVGVQDDYQMKIAQQVHTPATDDLFGYGVKFSVGAANRINANGAKGTFTNQNEGESWVKVTYLDG